LIGLMIPAVQATRESSRRTSCSNNLRNQALALQSFHANRNHFPPGKRTVGKLEFSWCLEILSYLEQQPLQARFDRASRWDSPSNLNVANAVIPVFRCPSGVEKFDGDIDYGGLMGSSLTSKTWAGAFGNGVLGEVFGTAEPGITTSAIIDGTSYTICIAESTDRGPADGGRWISGLNIFSQDNGGIESKQGGEIFSMHKTGAFVAFSDGSTRYLHNSIDEFVLGALCTRNLQEVINDGAY